MYSLAGTKNIRNILIFSLLILIIFNFFLFKQLINKKYSYSTNLNCLSVLNFNESTPERFKSLNDFCHNYSKKKNVELIFFIEPDNYSYFLDFFKMNKVIRHQNPLYAKLKNYNSELDQSLIIQTKDKIRALELNKQTNIKHRLIVESYSKIYIKFFDTNQYIAHFILFINFIILLFSVCLAYFFLNLIFLKLSRVIKILLVLNIFLIPSNLLYFLSFYKEPLILFSLILLICNFFYLLKNNLTIGMIIFSTIVIFFDLKIIEFIKLPYFAIYCLIFILSSIFLMAFHKRSNSLIFIPAQIVLLLISFNIDRIDFIKMKNIENIKILNNNNVKRNIFKKSQSPTIFVSDYSMKKQEEFILLNCNEFFLKACKKINTAAKTIYLMKLGTLVENLGNQSVINETVESGTIKIFYSIPFKVAKSFFMPVKISPNPFIIILSICKILLSILIFLILIMCLKNKTFDILKKFTILIFLLSPFTLAIELVTSNFFTYVRYIMPINLILLLFVGGYFAGILSSRDKYLYNLNHSA